MMIAAVVEQPAGATDAAARVVRVVVGRALDLRHDRDAGLETGQAEGEAGEDDQGDAHDDQRVAVLRW